MAAGCRKVETREGDTMTDVERENLKITVLMGGPSSEREVSLMSGRAVADGLMKMGHSVVCEDIAPRRTQALDREGIDVVFIALHGDFGESGEVQRLCEARKLSYTGSPPSASMFGMDKAAAKQTFRRVGLHTPEWVVIEEYAHLEETQELLDKIGLPVVVKPVSGGSSVDVWICHDEATRKEALEELLDVYARAMVEKFVPGEEFTVGILGEDPLPIIRIVPDGGFYDYHSKYSDDANTQYVFEHGLCDDAVARLMQDALTTHRSIGCRDFSRVDFIIDESGCPNVLEINTIPGFTSHSLLPKAAARAGVEFPELCDRIARMAAARDLKSEMVLS